MEFWRGLFTKKCTISETEVARPNFQDPHALQIDLVVKCVLQYLPLDDFKSFRLVCRKWNSVAEPILRKRSTLVPPENLIEYNPKSRLPNLPFSSFLLSNEIQKWNDSDWQEFCDLWLPKVKSLELHHIVGGLNTRYGRVLTEGLGDGTPLLHLAKNLVELRVSDCSVPLLLPLDAVNIKIILLNECSVIVNESGPSENRITPWKASLQHVLFTLRNGNKLPGITINDYMDFVNCSEIELVCSRSDATKITYDTLRDVTTARKINFEGIRMLGEKIFHEGLEYIKMASSFSEIQDPEILDYKRITKSDCFLPAKTIEKLTLPILYNSPMYRIPFERIRLPNLKYLNVTESNAYSLLRFKKCPNLTDIELSYIYKEIIELQVGYYFPQSVKRLKVSVAKLCKVKSFMEGDILNLNVLILDNCSMIPFADADRIMKKVKPKVLVIVLNTWVSSRDIISFIHRNIHMERVILKMPSPSLKKEFLYYEFNKQFGRGLTEVEFNKYFVLNK